MIVGIFLASLALAFEGEIGRYYRLDQDDVNEEEEDKDWLVNDGKNRPRQEQNRVQNSHQDLVLPRIHARCDM